MQRIWNFHVLKKRQAVDKTRETKTSSLIIRDFYMQRLTTVSVFSNLERQSPAVSSGSASERDLPHCIDHILLTTPQFESCME